MVLLETLLSIYSGADSSRLQIHRSVNPTIVVADLKKSHHIEKMLWRLLIDER